MMATRTLISASLAAGLAIGLTGCWEETSELQQGEESLGPIEAALDDVAKTLWPGNVKADGTREVRMLNGFFNNEATSYWFIGFASRLTADVFWFCREGDDQCPVDDAGVVQWDRVVGRPVFARAPGEEGFSPFWFTWKVEVPDDYEPDDLKSVIGIERAVKGGQVKVSRLVHDHGGAVGPDEALMHCLLVLEGTRLQNNGRDIIGKEGVKSHVIKPRKGWHKRFEISFFDFTGPEGVFPPDTTTESRPMMPSSDILVMFRDCEGGSQRPPCSRTSGELGAVSERGSEADLTGDGDKADTNNVIMAFPRLGAERLTDRVYSPLWRVRVVRVPVENDDLDLIDASKEQNTTPVKSLTQIDALVEEGRVLAPQPMTEDQAGNSIVGNDGKVFFNCPSQAPLDISTMRPVE